MEKEIWVLRHGHRLDRDNKKKWENSKRFKENKNDTPLSEFGLKKATKSGEELIKKSKAIQKKEIKYIYCSPYTRCIQTAIQIIDVVKKKLNYDIKIIIVYNLGEGGNGRDTYIFNGNKLNISLNCQKEKIIDKKLKPESLKKKYSNYIYKTIGNNIKYEHWNDERIRMANEIININKKEKNSYIIIGHLETAYLGYKYFNQKNINILDIKNKCLPGVWIYGSNECTNVMMGFKKKTIGYDMIYKPTYNFK